MRRAMGGIFISYRRDDSAPYARLLSDELGERFGQPNIVRDIDTIRPGTPFARAIETAVSSCDALIVVIGKEWLTVKNDNGRRRLDDPEDYVRLEVLAGLRRDDVLVVPVLVEKAQMPSEAELPPELAPLSGRMALEVSDAGWQYQVGQLVEVLTTVIPPATDPPQPPLAQPDGPALPPPQVQPAGSTRPPSRTFAIAGVLVVASVAGAVLLISSRTIVTAAVLVVTSVAGAVLLIGPWRRAREEGQIPSGEFFLPAGQRAALSGTALGGCNRLTYGYQLRGGPFVPLGVEHAPCSIDSMPDAVIGPYPGPVTFVLVLNDNTCGQRFDSSGPHAAVRGTNPYRVDIADQGGRCEAPGVLPPGPNGGNLRTTVAIG